MTLLDNIKSGLRKCTINGMSYLEYSSMVESVAKMHNETVDVIVENKLGYGVKLRIDYGKYSRISHKISDVFTDQFKRFLMI